MAELVTVRRDRRIHAATCAIGATFTVVGTGLMLNGANGLAALARRAGLPLNPVDDDPADQDETKDDDDQEMPDGIA